MAWSEKPPILTGNSKQDLTNLRDYLFRMAGSLNEVIADETRVAVQTIGSGKGTEKTIEEVRTNAQELRSLIIKSASQLRDEIESGDAEVMSYADSKEEIYDSRYLAVSQFGTFEENLNSRIETTARGVIDTYNYTSSIESLQDTIDLYQSYFESINGEIRRGVVEDPETHQNVIGIVISQSVTFTGQTYSPGDGYTYYEVAPNQTFGIYTSTGWQFWINGAKSGWFSSADSMLHVSNIIVENRLQAGDDWEITFSNGFGIKYLGV